MVIIIIIRMVSERSCDTEHWSNGCWKFINAITGINVFSRTNKLIEVWNNLRVSKRGPTLY